MRIEVLNVKTGEYELLDNQKWFRVISKEGIELDLLDEGDHIRLMTREGMNIKPRSSNVVWLEEFKY